MVKNKNHKNWQWRWILVAIFSLCCVLFISSRWNRRINRYSPRPNQLTSKNSVDIAIADYKQRVGGSDKIIEIPTGVFIQSVSFDNPYDVNFTGLIWQKYPDNGAKDISRGVLFPEQVDSNNTVIEEIYHRPGKGYEVIGWYFDVTVRQPFNYTKYPLDRHNVRLQIWDKDFSRSVVLTPDLIAYDSCKPGETFGTAEVIMPGGWQIDETWFGYSKKNQDTNFGIVEFRVRKGFPQLNFNVVMMRSFRNAIIVNLTPLFVVVTILFGLLLSMSTNEEQSDRFGFDNLAVLGACSGLLFVVIMAHIEWRTRFPGSQLSYLECFYLVTYLLIVLVGFNGYLMTNEKTRRYLGRYNYACQLIFWPMLFGSLSVITLFYF